MKDLPFTISAEAAKFIDESLICAQREIKVVLQFVPILWWASNHTSWDKSGRIIDHYPGEFFGIGWNRADEIDNFERFVQLDLFGCTVYASPETLELLRGKELRLHKQSALSLLIAHPPRMLPGYCHP